MWSELSKSGAYDFENYGVLKQIINSRFGIISEISEIRHSSSEPQYYNFIAKSCLTGFDSGQNLIGAGMGETRSKALWSAVGEVIERYCAIELPAQMMSTNQNIERVNLSKWPLFSEEQYSSASFPFVPASSVMSDDIKWVEAKCIKSGAIKLVPAQMVPLSYKTGDEKVLTYTTSSGLACDPSLDTAILKAILELVERDAFMIVWNNRYSPPRLAWEENTILYSHFEKHFPRNISLESYDLTEISEIPTVLSILKSSSCEYAIGLGANLNYDMAWRSSVREAAQSYIVMDRAKAANLSPNMVETFEDHMRYYIGRTEEMAFLFSNTSTKSIQKGVNLNYEQMLDRLPGEIFSVDMTHEDISNMGLKVIRVLSDSLHPLDCRHDWRFLGGDRLYNRLFDLGIVERPLKPCDLNPLPHPFP